MQLIKITLLLFLITFSSISIADTYPATITFTYGTKSFSTYQQGCAYSDTQTHYVTVSYQWLNSMWACVNAQGGLNAYISKNTSCPYGGTLSGTSCINAPTCPTGQTRDSKGQCTRPPLTCAAGQYDDGTSTTCQPIPDCNANTALGGNYFSTTTKSCQSVSPVTICIDGADESTKYCPPLNNCKPSGFICTDESTVVSTETAKDSAAKTQAQSEATEKQNDIDRAKQAAADTVTEKTQKAADAKAAKEAAAAEVQAARASGDSAALNAATAKYSNAVKAYIDSLSRLTNATAAASKATDIQTASTPIANAVPTDIPHNAQTHNNQLTPYRDSAITAMNDAVTGDGNGTGTGSGVSTSTSSPKLDTTGLATDSTLNGLGDTLKGIHGELKGEGASGSYDKGIAPTGPVSSFYTSSYPQGLQGVWNTHRAAINNTALMNSLNAMSNKAPTSGECPSWIIDFSGIGLGSSAFSIDCSTFGFVKIAMLLTATFAARRIIFGG